eukprot:TRINITY_DN1373_c0_g1_i2.p1 TRINITY_DN1373_c0_g1~~TRINITY_DN1373_c0_g1_i2.p1  ORF type:complete len:391 (-),score=122.48 TRINITY_DN1373_c0_g1_i2:60-1232(-)
MHPNVAIDHHGNRGTWTAVYNQGYQVEINNDVWFAFSKYTKNSDGTYTSVCNATLPGWVHTSEGEDWGCYFAEQMHADARVYTPEERTLAEDVASKPFVVTDEEIERINNAQSQWTATRYSQWEELTVGQVNRIAGTPSHRVPRAAPRPKNEQDERVIASLPQEFTWTNVNGVNYVSPIRNQEQCGSCYTFATTAALEARLRIQSNMTQTDIFAPQSILSCSQYSQKCEGGFAFLVSKFGKDFHRITTEECFPYTGSDDTPCKYCDDKSQYWGIKDYGYVGNYFGNCSESGMMQEIFEWGPVAVGFEVHKDFMSYKSGVYHCNKTAPPDDFVETNHAVLVVGWGVENGTPYWLVKNSWGTTWGLDGFFKIQRGINTCGIEEMASWQNPLH